MGSYKLTLEQRAQDDLSALDATEAEMIIKKLRWFVSQENPLLFAKRMKGNFLTCHRFRVGNYRVVFECDGLCIRVRRIGHRSTIYQ